MKRRTWGFRVGLVAVVALLLACGAWVRWVQTRIEHFADQDEAAPSDAIAVFGAAEYAGKPSPVYKARLDHAEDLYNKGIAPLIVTLGGDGGDEFSEGGVGRTYLMGAGVPQSAIIAETLSRNTAEAARRLAVIARANGFKRIVVVSDETHMFRIRELCAANGLEVLTSPRSRVPVEGGTNEADPVLHEILSYTAWRLHLE